MTSATTRVRRADRTIVGAFQITNMGKLVAVAVKCSPSQSATLAREAARQGFVLISNGFSKETGAEILCFRPYHEKEQPWISR